VDRCAALMNAFCFLIQRQGYEPGSQKRRLHLNNNVAAVIPSHNTVMIHTLTERLGRKLSILPRDVPIRPSRGSVPEWIL